MPIGITENLWNVTFNPIFLSLSASNPLLTCFNLSLASKSVQKDPTTVYLDQFLKIWYVRWESKSVAMCPISELVKNLSSFQSPVQSIGLIFSNFFFPERYIPWAHSMFTKLCSNINYMFTVKFQLRWVSNLRKSSKHKIALKWEPSIGISIRFLRCDPLG